MARAPGRSFHWAGGSVRGRQVLAADENAVFAKCAWRLLPLLLAAYITNYIDRTNIGFAALTMNRELGFSPSVFGFGAGIFFVGYALFQVPSNIALHRVGASRWICFIIALWGLASAGTSLIGNAHSFYAMRFLLGIAEAGLVPGVVLYLTFWFSKEWLCFTTAIFMTATHIAPVVGGPIASLVFRLDGIWGIHGWRWLFLIEGLPAVLIAVAVFAFLPDRPARASWLTAEDRKLIERSLQREDATKEQSLIRALRDYRVVLLGIGYGLYLLAGYGLSLWTPLVLQQAGFSNSAAGYLTSLIFVAGVPAMIFWGRDSDRRGERIWHAALAAALVSAAFAAAAASPGNAVVLIALAVAAIGTGSFLTTYYAIPALFLAGPAMAGGFGLINTIGNLLGGFAGQYAVGVLRQQTGSYASVFAALSGATLAAGVIALIIGRSITPRVEVLAVPAQ